MIFLNKLRRLVWGRFFFARIEQRSAREMKIESLKFAASIKNIAEINFKRLPEIAIAGRSNVGKSSMINCLVNRKNLAKTSSTPGKTRLLNYYCVNEKFYLVDLPGYGYAKVPLQERRSWKDLVETYLTNNHFLKAVIQIIDSRQGITKLDQEMISWLTHLSLPTLLVATKTDKLPRSKANHLIKKIENEAIASGVTNLEPFSTVTKQGKDQIWRSIVDLLN
jgi:GTP-binding protein